MADRIVLAVGAAFVTWFAMYGWWTFCERHVDPFIKRGVRRVLRRQRARSE